MTVPEYGQDEGDVCGRDGCRGVMTPTSDGNCSCFLAEPCWSCLGSQMVCDYCSACADGHPPFPTGVVPMKQQQRGNGAVGLLLVSVVIVLVFLMFGLPMWNMWRAEKSGEAELAQANYTRQIATAEAKAKSESATYLAEAEVTRARGAAQANKIIADGLGGPEGYLSYLKIQALEQTKNQVIYVPTEASLPITESGKR
jgi:hypothetical protein